VSYEDAPVAIVKGVDGTAPHTVTQCAHAA